MDLFFKVRQYVLGELDSMVAAGELPSNLDMAGVTVEPPRDPLHGDMAIAQNGIKCEQNWLHIAA